MAEQPITETKEKKKWYRIYRVIRFFVWLFYPKLKPEGTENLPDEPCVIVGNHTQMNGPIIGELYGPGKHAIWCAGEMMHWDEVAAYAFRDFWSQKPAWTHPFYRLLARLITPLSVVIFNNAHTVPVYHDVRLRNTYRISMELLEQGSSMIIFPEHDEHYNNIVCAFQDRFIDLARFYYKKTGKALQFVPMYCAPTLKRVLYGRPIRFDPAAPIDEERARICRYLQDEITAIARSLPRHVVVPYRNIRKKDYPYNT